MEIYFKMLQSSHDRANRVISFLVVLHQLLRSRYHFYNFLERHSALLNLDGVVQVQKVQLVYLYCRFINGIVNPEAVYIELGQILRKIKWYNFDFQKTELSFTFTWFESFRGFVILDRWEDRTYCLPSLLFGHENGSFEYFWKKEY